MFFPVFFCVNNCRKFVKWQLFVCFQFRAQFIKIARKNLSNHNILIKCTYSFKFLRIYKNWNKEVIFVIDFVYSDQHVIRIGEIVNSLILKTSLIFFNNYVPSIFFSIFNPLKWCRYIIYMDSHLSNIFTYISIYPGIVGMVNEWPSANSRIFFERNNWRLLRPVLWLKECEIFCKIQVVEKY